MADNEAQAAANAANAATQAQATQQATDQAVTDATAEAAKAEAEKATPKTYSQEEVDRIAAKVKKNAAYRAKKEVEAYYRGLQQGTQVTAPKPVEPAQPEAPKEPQRADFEDYEAYLTARAEFRADQAVEKRLAKEREATTRTQSQTEMEALRQNFVKQAEALAAEVDDFDEAMDTQVRMPDGMVQAILETDIPARVAYHLAKNPEERDRISALSSAKQAIAIGRLEAKLAADIASKGNGQAAADAETNIDGGAASAKTAATAASGLPATATGAQASKAPAPIKPVGGKSTVGNEMPDPKTNPDAWYKWRQQQVAQRARAAQKQA